MLWAITLFFQSVDFVTACPVQTPEPVVMVAPEMEGHWERGLDFPVTATAEFDIDLNGAPINILVDAPNRMVEISVIRAVERMRFNPSDACRGAEWIYKLEITD